MLIALGAACGCREEAQPPYIRLDEKAPAVPGAPPAQVLVVSFWATWCPPCREELPELTALARAAPGGLEVVAVSQDPELAPVERFLGGPADPSLHLRLDRDRALSAAFGVEKLPVSFVIAQGRLVARFDGPRRWNSGAMRKLLRRLGEQPSP
ncbi:MAG: TlpA family protein disulfide reductase [Myxococcaceae bacterium]